MPKTSHGGQTTALTAAIAAGSRVSDAASSGSAVTRMPSPRFETALEVHSRRKGEMGKARRLPAPVTGDRGTLSGAMSPERNAGLTGVPTRT